MKIVGEINFINKKKSVNHKRKKKSFLDHLLIIIIRNILKCHLENIQGTLITNPYIVKKYFFMI